MFMFNFHFLKAGVKKKHMCEREISVSVGKGVGVVVRIEHMQLTQMKNTNKGTDDRSQKGCFSK